jgi:hypothetical protein
MTWMCELARRLPGVLCVLLLAACGGGGGGGSPQSDPAGALLPTLSQDIEPSGPRTDVRALNLFPVHAGDSWVYERREGAGLATATRTISSGPDAGGRFDVTESQSGPPETSSYQLTSAGVLSIDPVGADGVWPNVLAVLPSLLDYPNALFAVGAERKAIRQGALGADLENDGKNDFYRVEIGQVFRGFETLTVLGRPTQVAHFSNRFAFTAKVTRDLSSFTATATEEAYFAPQLGLVRSERSAVGSNGAIVVAPYSMTLVIATIASQRFDASGSSRTVALATRAMVFDPVRSVYYASQSVYGEPASSRIATIDAASGAVSHSPVLDSEPGPLALAADGQSLYVGLGSGDVLRLALPSMQELGRMRLPVDPTYGQTWANDIAASPVAADVFAASLFRPTVSTSGGVVLVRGMVVQPLRTASGRGGNRIGFGADGQSLFGIDTQTPNHSLYHIEVGSDGLIERSEVGTGGIVEGFDVRDGLILVSNQVYRADASMTLLGTATNGSSCVKLRGTNKISCQSVLGLSQFNVYDSSTLLPLASLIATQGASSSARFLAGPRGAIAVSDSGRLTLFAAVELE